MTSSQEMDRAYSNKKTTAHGARMGLPLWLPNSGVLSNPQSIIVQIIYCKIGWVPEKVSLAKSDIIS